jgi:hypothetical protein
MIIIITIMAIIGGLRIPGARSCWRLIFSASLLQNVKMSFLYTGIVKNVPFIVPPCK